MLEIEKVSLVIVDIQGNLAHLMHGKQQLFKNVKKLIKVHKPEHIAQCGRLISHTLTG